MNISEILKEIERLPNHERIMLIEMVKKTLRREEEADRMRHAARELQVDYEADKELTAFTDLDLEDFYEPR